MNQKYVKLREKTDKLTTAQLEEVRRQSLLAAKEDNAQEIMLWENNTDITGWE